METTELVSQLPEWAQAVFFTITSAGIAWMGLRNYRKPPDGPPAEDASEAQLIAGAVFDSNSMRDLKVQIVANTVAVKDLEERLVKSERSLCECVGELTEELRKARHAAEDLRRHRE